MYTEHPLLTISFGECSFGVQFEVTVPPEVSTKEFEVTFLLLVSDDYPSTPPRILCDTAFTYPSLSDGRDLISLIFPIQRAVQHSLATIVNNLPRLIFEIESISIHRVNIFTVGGFTLGSLFDLEYWEGKENMRAFTCLEIDHKSSEIIGRMALVVTHVCVLQIASEEKGTGKLVKWASLNNLHSIKRSKSSPDAVTLQWTISEKPFVQCFNIPLSDEFIDLLMLNTTKMGIVVDRQLPKSGLIQEDEVSAKRIRDFDVSGMAKQITELENKVLGPEDLTSLMQHYQTAIEYYSAVNSNEYKEYLQKLHSLFESGEDS